MNTLPLISCYLDITCTIKIHEKFLRNSEEIHMGLPHGYMSDIRFSEGCMIAYFASLK